MDRNHTQGINAGYVPALDGLRGLAILLVVVAHYGFGNLIPGGFGVTLFFFISGFLITRLLIAEHETTGGINLKNFYLRRLLRLSPALLFMGVVSMAYTLLIGCPLDAGDIASSLFYYRNYYMVFTDLRESALCTKVYNIVWSLAVEEHFYMVFPLLFIGLFRQKNGFLVLLLVAIIAAPCWRIYLATQGLDYAMVNRIYRLTDTRYDAILYGCFVSLLMHRAGPGAYVRFAGNRLVFAGAVGLLVFTLVYRDLLFRETLRYSAQGVAMAVLVPAALYHKTYARLMRYLSTPFLIQTGKISYSLYMFHWVGVCFAEYYVTPDRKTLPFIAVAALVGFSLTYISYRFVEKPTQKLRKRFGSNVGADVPVTVPTGGDLTRPPGGHPLLEHPAQRTDPLLTKKTGTGHAV